MPWCYINAGVLATGSETEMCESEHELCDCCHDRGGRRHPFQVDIVKEDQREREKAAAPQHARQTQVSPVSGRLLRPQDVSGARNWTKPWRHCSEEALYDILSWMPGGGKDKMVGGGRTQMKCFEHSHAEMGHYCFTGWSHPTPPPPPPVSPLLHMRHQLLFWKKHNPYMKDGFMKYCYETTFWRVVSVEDHLFGNLVKIISLFADVNRLGHFYYPPLGNKKCHGFTPWNCREALGAFCN